MRGHRREKRRDGEWEKKELLNYEDFVDMVSESLGIERENLHENSSFLRDLGIDSLSLVNFIVKLEKKYGVKFDLANVWELKNVREAYELFVSSCTQLGGQES